jgi:beta-N-acetylhexosaminidase
MNRELLDLAASTIVTGFEGTELDGATRERLAALPFAGFILFARNLQSLEQSRALTDALRALTVREPLLAIDQEGGRVARLQAGVEVLPPMMALGAVNDTQAAYEAGEQLGFDLRRAGFNVDFAPVLDLAVDPANTVIGTRAFGASPELVARMGGALGRGLVAAGVVPVYKHFPGHGATSDDTHLGHARLDCDAETFDARDLAPFALLAPDAPAIMAAHVAVPHLDGDRPASLSRVLLTGVLRERLRFEGVCFTDCLQMDAIARGVGTAQAVVQALAAGADCAIVSHDPQLAAEAARCVVSAVVQGTLDEARLREASSRIARLREVMKSPLPLDAPAPHPGIGARIARRAITLVRGSLPLAPGTPVLRVRRAHLDPLQRERIAAILARAPESAIVSVAEPFDVAEFPQARTAVAAYGDDELMQRALAEVLAGAPCEGRLPV